MIKRKFCIFLIITIALLTSCSGNNINATKTNIYELKPIKEIEFKNGIRSTIIDYYSNNETEYCLMYDFQTTKKIYFGNLETEKIEFEIQLDTVLYYCGGIRAADIINPDTVIVLAEYTNQLFFINRIGAVWKKIDLNPYLMEKGYFELSSELTSFILDDNTLLFRTYFSPENDTTGKSYNNQPTKFEEESYSSPYLFQVCNIFEDSITTKFGADGYYAQFIRTNQSAFEYGYRTSDEKLIYLISIYTDTVYAYDKVTMKLKNKYCLKSDYTILGHSAPSLDEIEKNANYPYDLIQTKGSLENIIFDKSRNLFFITAVHTIPRETPVKERIKPWSILIYDQIFNKLDEIKMDEKKYSPFGIFVTKKGLLIFNYAAKKDDKDIFTKTTFELFELVKK